MIPIPTSIHSESTGKLMDCKEPEWPPLDGAADSGPPYRKTEGSGDDDKEKPVDKTKINPATNKGKDDDKNSEAERNVFGKCLLLLLSSRTKFLNSYILVQSKY